MLVFTTFKPVGANSVITSTVLAQKYYFNKRSEFIHEETHSSSSLGFKALHDKTYANFIIKAALSTFASFT